MHFNDICYYSRMMEFKNEDALKIVQTLYKDEPITAIKNIDDYSCSLTVNGETLEYSTSAILMNYSKVFGEAFDKAYPEANH